MTHNARTLICQQRDNFRWLNWTWYGPQQRRMWRNVHRSTVLPIGLRLPRRGLAWSLADELQLHQDETT